MSIPLPALPLPSIDAWPNTLEKLRARDLEVARVVLEGAANQAENTICSCCYPDGSDAVAEDISAAIRALEVSHE